jgi:hypothetical protein
MYARMTQKQKQAGAPDLFTGAASLAGNQF